MVYFALAVVAASLLYIACRKSSALWPLDSACEAKNLIQETKQSLNLDSDQESEDGRRGVHRDDGQPKAGSRRDEVTIANPKDRAGRQFMHIGKTTTNEEPLRGPKTGQVATVKRPDNPSPPEAPVIKDAEAPLQSPPSSQRPPPPKTTSSATAMLMPPPSVRPSAIRPLAPAPAPPPSFAAGLRAPPTASRAPTAALAPSASTLAPGARPSRAVALAAGRSPLDWAQLTRHPPTPTFLRGPGVPALAPLRVSPAMLRRRNGRKGMPAWASYRGRVYNVTPYLEYHPGGVREIMKGIGREGVAERLFAEVHPWVNWDGMLGECAVGILVGEGEGDEDGEGAAEQVRKDRRRMEEMD